MSFFFTFSLSCLLDQTLNKSVPLSLKSLFYAFMKLIFFFLFLASSFPEERLRYWNGYLLFYERMEEPNTPNTAKRSRILSRRMLPQGGYVVHFVFSKKLGQIAHKK